jgi:alkyldihydroxyacetonephosphate synthase
LIFFRLQAVVRGQVFIGKIHIAAAEPLQMNCETSGDYKAFGKQVQQLQREMVLVSDYHISAAAKFFNVVDQSSIKEVMESLGCKFWPSTIQTNLSRALQIPTDESSLFSILLQCSPYLAPMFFTERKKWSRWLYHDVQSAFECQGKCKSTQRVYKVLLEHFDYADSLVSEAVTRLNENGFHQPKRGHVLQVALELNKRTLKQLVRAAVAMEFPECNHNDHSQSSPVAMVDLKLDDTSEKLGYWGFNDSGFVVTPDSRGDRTVKMQGTRYALAGKSMAKLLPFIESEMQVKVNLMKEFQPCQSIFQDYRPGALDDSGKQSLLTNFKRVSFSTLDRIRHGTGHSQEDVYGIREGCKFRIPDAVVWPASETQIEELIGLAKQRKWCLIPYGGGTNVTCATRCPEETVEKRPIISVDMKLMCRILWLNGEDGVARIEAGITGRQLVEELHLRGYTMGHEPDSIEFSTLGGWIATKASGMKRSKYGNIEDIVKDVRVISNTPIWKGSEDAKTFPGRESEGMEPLSLILGSEGCLGIITSAVIRIWPLPEATEFDSIVFPSFSDGLSFARAVARLGGNSPASVRILDNAHFRLGQALRPESPSVSGRLKELVARFLALSSKFRADSIVCATITYEGGKSEVDWQKRAIQQIARLRDGTRLGPSVGKAGYDLTFMIAYLRDFALTYHMLGESFETFVPWSKIEALIEATKRRIAEEHQSQLLPGLPFVGCRVTQLYHEGACLYFYLCISIDGVDNGSEVFTALETAAREEILKHGGSLSHHHGIGKLKAPFLSGKSSQGFEKTVAMVKKGIDTDNIFGARNGLFAALPAEATVDDRTV